MVSESQPECLIGLSVTSHEVEPPHQLCHCYQRVRSFDSFLARDDAVLTHQPLKPLHIRLNLRQTRGPERLIPDVDPKGARQRRSIRQASG